MRQLLSQIAIGIGTSFLVSLALDHWRAAKAVAPLPKPPADGLDQG